MFSNQTEQALAQNLTFEAYAPGLVQLPAEVYRELVAAARAWDAVRSGGKLASPAPFVLRLPELTEPTSPD